MSIKSKKQEKKLALQRETLRTLDQSQLAAVVGGAFASTSRPPPTPSLGC